MDTCTTCRNPLVPGAKFCGLCGQRVAAAASPEPAVHAPFVPPPPAPAVSQPAAVAPPPRRGKQVPGGVVAAGAAALLLVVGLVLGAVLMGLGDDSAPPPAGTSAESAVAIDPSPAEESRTAVPTVTCWDGASRPAVTDCSPVRGVSGMRWAMPPLDRRFGQCAPASAYDGKVRAFGCDLTTARGSKARVTFSEWSSYAAGDDHYREKYGAPDRTDSQFNIWEPTYVKDDYQTSRMFTSGLPFSVTVASSDRGIADAVMSGFSFRPSAETKPYLR